MDEIHTKLFVERFYEECGMQDLDMRKYIETSLFVSVMSILNENWFEKDRWDAKTMKSSSLVQYDISDIAYAEYKNAEEEFGFIVNRIVKLHSIGVPYSEMAVLLRKCDKENCSKCHFNYLCLSKAEKKVFEIG